MNCRLMIRYNIKFWSNSNKLFLAILIVRTFKRNFPLHFPFTFLKFIIIIEIHGCNSQICFKEPFTNQSDDPRSICSGKTFQTFQNWKSLISQVFENYKASTIGIFSFFLKFSTCESVIHYKISLGKNETSYLPLAR